MLVAIFVIREHSITILHASFNVGDDM